MDFSKLKPRVISGLILIVCLVVFSFAPIWLFAPVVCCASIVALREIMVTFQLGSKMSLIIANYVFAALYLICAFFPAATQTHVMLMLTILFMMTLSILSVVDHKHVSFRDASTSLFVVLYVVVFFIHFVFLRRTEHAYSMVLLCFIGAWVPDTTAYFAGNFFGKHKLIEAISPKKTVEGSIGAFVGAVVGFVVFGIIMNAMGYVVNFFALLILALLCGAAAQLGDLAASVMKRAYNAKDFGKLIPGHGGLLDRIDSLLFVTPLVYYFISYFPVVY